MRSIFCFLISFLCFQCSSQGDQKRVISESSKFEDKYSIIPIADKVISLDSTTSVDQIGYVIHEDKTMQKQYLFMLNYLNNSIQKYDWQKNKLISSTKLEIEGPNGVGNPTGIGVMSEDSIYILASYQRKLSLISKNGRILNRILLYDNLSQKGASERGVFPLGNHANHMSVSTNKIIIGGGPYDEYTLKSFYSKGKVGIIVGKESNSIDYIMPMPKHFIEDYENGRYLCSQQSLPSLTYNEKKNTAVINFLTDPNIYEVNLDSKKIDAYYAGSKQFEHIELSKKIITDAGKEFDFFLKQPNFSEIFYDRHNDIYLRFVSFPNPKKVDENDGKSWWNISVILLNASFKKIGEVELSPEYRRGEVIISKEGIYIRKYKDSETELVFTLFKLQKKDV
jgi:hypothetical protein